MMPTFLTPMSQSEMKENPRKSPSVPPNSATKGEIYVSTVMLKNIKEYYLYVTKFGFHSDTSCTTSLGLVSQICQQLVTDS